MLGVRRQVVSALVVAGALAAGGCTGEVNQPDPERSGSATVHLSVELSPSPTPARVPAATKPERPDAMDRLDEAGAAAAAKYFLSLYAYVMRTGDLDEWDAMTTPVCDFCKSISEAAGGILSKGGRYSGGEIRVTKIVVDAYDPDLEAYAFEASIRQRSSVESDAKGVPLKESAARTGNVRVEVLNGQLGWGILAVINEDS